MSEPPPGTPPPTLYHRVVGWHAATLRRTTVVLAAGSLVALALVAFVPWQLAVLAGWDAAAAAFLGAVSPLVLRSSPEQTAALATREDETRTVGALLLLGVCVASLVGGGFALAFAGQRTGTGRALPIALAGGTVVLSWLVLNTVYTLRYAHLYYGTASGGVAFNETETEAATRADYRDFAYLAFTIGMTYQVSDTTLRDPTFRRTVLSHALLAYLFGVVIVAGAINLIAGLVR